ncbi:MAG: toluene tolerance protein [Deltaproteobacteria bacterium]|nr:MAG: toluene tolerance protein [Deltaproteobacteria bacterium]
MIKSRFERLDRNAYRELLAGCTVVEQDAHGEKVLRTAGGEMIKIFRRKRLLSTALLFPYARRFARNVARLTACGISTVEVNRLLCCPPLGRHLVIYRPLPGRTLRETLRLAPENLPRNLDLAASFIATLHQKGVYFRSLHFGNVIVPPAGEPFGLIDVADMTFRAGPLPIRLRVRNFRHVLRYAEDREALSRYGRQRFADRYLASAGMQGAARAEFLRNLHRHVPMMAGETDDEPSCR